MADFKMYLFIYVGGDIIKKDYFIPLDKQDCKKGDLELIDISNPANPLYYNSCSDTWDEIE